MIHVRQEETEKETLTLRTLHDFTPGRKNTALVLVDFQERLFQAMASDRQDAALKNTLLLLDLVSQLRIPYRWEGGGSQQVLPTEDLRYREGM